jgi:hypothetical protein
MHELLQLEIIVGNIRRNSAQCRAFPGIPSIITSVACQSLWYCCCEVLFSEKKVVLFVEKWHLNVNLRV